MEFIIKAIIGGIIIATVSTVSERYPTIGAFILGIPLASFVSFIFMYYAGVDVQTFKTISTQTIYFVLVSLLFFPMFVYMLPTYGFWTAMMIGTAITGSLMFTLSRFLN
ncbi:MAG: hypothetical protein CBC05_02900 [Crocinitomicaceae bacterium TMED45]|nr:MAG: hypothetical protein CBC05_02900 [Crocinitomicaceae bacterium TMED45]|tara:strand:- start:157 stop:483 length:327 start_codon:yes stop_codon:yes gene_type:complete